MHFARYCVVGIKVLFQWYYYTSMHRAVWWLQAVQSSSICVVGWLPFKFEQSESWVYVVVCKCVLFTYRFGTLVRGKERIRNIWLPPKPCRFLPVLLRKRILFKVIVPNIRFSDKENQVGISIIWRDTENLFTTKSSQGKCRYSLMNEY